MAVQHLVTALTWFWKDFASSGNPKELKKDTTSVTVHNEVSGGRLLLLFSVSLAESRIAVEVPFPGEPVNVKKQTNKQQNNLLTITIAKGPSTRSANPIFF